MEAVLRHKGRDPWSGVMGKYKTCYDGIGTYITRSGNKYTGLTEEDETRLEKAIGYPEGHLSKKSPFWSTFTVKIGEKELVVNTEDAFDEIKYLFLKGHKRVANGINMVTPSKDWILIDREAEAKEVNIKGRKKREAFKELDKMSIEEMRKALRLYGVKSDNISAELVEQKLTEVIEKNPEMFFIKWVNNKNKEIEFLIEEALSKNIMRKTRNIYYYGTETIGSSLEDTAAYLKSAKGQELKISILEEIKSKK